MKIVLAAALGVGGATIVGACLGFMCKGIPHRFRDMILSFAAGVMLAASILGLILPAMEFGSLLSIIPGIFAGAFCLDLADRFIPHLHVLAGIPQDSTADDKRLHGVFLFVMAIAIHNFPEGIAAGVSFGTGDVDTAILIAGGIALQNIPEGMVIISPMLSAGISPRRTFLCGLLTGMIEVVGTVIGYFTIRVSTSLLPFALGFAGGTMLYVISDEMIPETHTDGSENPATYALLAGFSMMLVFDTLLG